MIAIPQIKYKQLPKQYEWVLNEPAPKFHLEAIRHYGIMEIPGPKHDPEIMKWGKELGVSNVNRTDEVPWCGLFPGICIKRSNPAYPIPRHVYRAKAWLNWGREVKIGEEPAMWYDILIFDRAGGGHLCWNWGQAGGTLLRPKKYLGYGGNQSNMVKASWFPGNKLAGIRRCEWLIGQPENIRTIILDDSGEPYSDTEA